LINGSKNLTRLEHKKKRDERPTEKTEGRSMKSCGGQRATDPKKKLHRGKIKKTSIKSVGGRASYRTQEKLTSQGIVGGTQTRC